MHAFVAGNLADDMEKNVEVGNVYCISDFTVNEYKADEKFRCIYSDKQIAFTNSTKVKLMENDKLIADNMFDFYDLGDLKEIADKNVYLTGIIYSSYFILLN